MQADIWSRRAGWLGLVGWVLLSGTLVQAQLPETPRDVLKQVRPRTDLIDDRDAAELQPTEYWIGVATSDELINDTVRAQLGLKEGEGIAVLSVRADSPAAKAGLQENDVLVRAGDRLLKGVQDLIEAVEAAKGQELSVVLYRGGKEQTVSVTPVKRPEDMQRTPQEAFRAWVQQRAGAPQDDVIINRWFSGEENGPLGMWMVRPGVAVPLGAQRSQPLPENMTVTITKQGKEPAKISVRRGDESWEVTEDKISELPEDVRAHVHSMLSHHPAGFNFRLTQPMSERLPGTTSERRSTRSKSAEKGDAAQGQLDDVQKQVQELRQSVEELKRLMKDKNQ